MRSRCGLPPLLKVITDVRRNATSEILRELTSQQVSSSGLKTALLLVTSAPQKIPLACEFLQICEVLLFTDFAIFAVVNICLSLKNDKGFFGRYIPEFSS